MAKTRRRKKRTHVPETEDPGKKGPPKSFVFWRGQHGTILKSLEADLRKLMQPHTATNLKESKRNQLKDFVNVAGPLGISHFLILTATENSCYLRIAKTPRGPTLTMRIHTYSLMRDVIASQLRPRQPDSLWKTSPLVVMNNFSGQEHLKLASVLFQNLFPAINVQTAQLASCQRVVLLDFDKATNRISFRHFSIVVQPCGVTKSVKTLIGKRKVPDLGTFQDVAEFLTKSGYGSESEGEDAADGRVTLAQDMGRGNLASRQSRIRLQEIGPRMELEIVKAEEGMCTGEVLYHQHINKSKAEVAEKSKEIQDREELREKRRRQQDENVKRKESLKRKAVPEKGGKDGAPSKRPKKEWWDKDARSNQGYEDDDDVEHYRREVGEEPEDTYGLTSKVGRGKFGERGRGGARGRGRARGGRGRGRGGGRRGADGEGRGKREGGGEGFKPRRSFDKGEKDGKKFGRGQDESPGKSAGFKSPGKRQGKA